MEIEQEFNEARIIVLGEKGAGKTSLARRLLNINAPMSQGDDSTEGVEISPWTFKDKNGTNINTYIWDFAGHFITHAAHRWFMSARCLYIYVYNGGIERDNDPAYWLEQIHIHGGDSPVLFLINEKDDHSSDIAKKSLKNEYPSIVDYYRVNIKNDKTKLKEFRQTVMDTVSKSPFWDSRVVSMVAFKIKKELRDHFGKRKSPYITRDEFEKIAQSCRAPAGSIDDILNYLHTLGICLWYNKQETEEFFRHVLNPDWITYGIYRIINQSHIEKKYKLTMSEGIELLRNDERYNYSRDNVAYLFKLMKLYELAFSENTDNIFIPGILPIDRPAGVPTFDDANDRLTMSFVVDKALPPGITARIILHRSEEIFDEKLLWFKGAVLKYKSGNAIALIIEESRSITVSVKGTEKTDYNASLRETIKAIFDDYKVIKSDLLYEVLIPEETPLRLSEKEIRKLLKEVFLLSKKIKPPLNETQQAYDIDIRTEEEFNQLLTGLEKFRESDQAGDLRLKDVRALQTEIDEVRKLGVKKGWERLLNFFSSSPAGSAVTENIMKAKQEHN
jgi:GTPase SAR1 family protein